MADLIDFGRRKLKAGSGAAVGVSADKGRHLVEGHEVLDAVGEPFGDVAGVVGERFGGVAGSPATFVFEGLREIPVEERAIGLDACREKLVEHAIVEVEAFRIGCACASREDAWPRYGE